MHSKITKQLLSVSGFLFFVLMITFVPVKLISVGLISEGSGNEKSNLEEVGSLSLSSANKNENSQEPNVTKQKSAVQNTLVLPLKKEPAGNSGAPYVAIAPNTASASTYVGEPVRLVIPVINVSANIEHIGLTSEGSVGVPQGNKDVSWFIEGPKPGEQGSALISGHYGIWKNNTHSVFDYLDTLKPGDDIYVEDDKGVKRTFVVQSTNTYGKDDTVPELFNRNDAAYLNIITCHGQWLPTQKTYSKRFVIFAKLEI